MPDLPSCLHLLSVMARTVDDVNLRLLEYMTRPGVDYKTVCVRTNITYDAYFNDLKESWEQVIEDFSTKPICGTGYLPDILSLLSHANPEQLRQYQAMIQQYLEQPVTSGDFMNATNVNLDNVVLEALAYRLRNPSSDKKFQVKIDGAATIKSLAQFFHDNCRCQLPAIFKWAVNQYGLRYRKKFQDKSQEEVITQLRQDYQQFRETIGEFSFSDSSDKKVYDSIATKLSSVYSLSVENELNRLIPDELGSLKQFFVKVINHYYTNLHPIIWAQIFRASVDNGFKELPLTQAEIFEFFSKQLLLNSGPFILKILQLTRPVLSEEIATKYGLSDLKYPLLNQREIKLVFKRILRDPTLYKILANYSASVGHVCKVLKVTEPEKILIIKIIKPLAIAESCLEYSIMANLFPRGSCESEFLLNMLNSNGRELNVDNERKNLEEGHKAYTTDYKTVFKVPVTAYLTTIQSIPGVIKEGVWYALALTLAPGMPLGALIKKDELKADTRFRANLHRCLDLLIHQFFYNLINTGFYHGDLHAGNIFYSFQERCITLIDFGAVGRIDLFKNDQDIHDILDMIIMQTFYDFDTMFDKLTDVLNTKCNGEGFIDKSDPDYQALRTNLTYHKINNTLNQEAEAVKTQRFRDVLNSEERIKWEEGVMRGGDARACEASQPRMMPLNSNAQVQDQVYSIPSQVYSNVQGQVYSNVPDPMPISEPIPDALKNESIYDILEKNLYYASKPAETVIENKEILPQYAELMGKSQNISFAGVLELIIKFYATHNVNIAIKFNELAELQKAYALLLGTISKTGYNTLRTGIAIERAVKKLSNLKKAVHLNTTEYVVKKYLDEKKKFKELKEAITDNRININDYPAKYESVKQPEIDSNCIIGEVVV